jgi:hypothetical protein
MVSPNGAMIMAGGQVYLPKKLPCVILMKSLVKLSQAAAAAVVRGRAEKQNIRASGTNLTLLINQDKKIAGREKWRVRLLGNIFLEEIVRRLHQYGIGTTDVRRAQVYWAVSLMIVFIMTGMTGAWSIWTAPHMIVLATLTAETAVHTFLLSIDLANSTTGIAYQVVLTVPLVGGPITSISETAAHFVMTDHHLNVIGSLTLMK